MSNEKYDDWFDEAFDEAFDRAASRSSLPTDDESKRQSWQQVKLQVEKLNKRKQRKRRFQLAGVIAASMAFGALMFSPSTVTQAVSPIYQHIVDWGNGVAGQLFGKELPEDKGKALTSPPPESTIIPDDHVPPAEEIEIDYIPFTDKDESLTKSQSRVSYMIPHFDYIPEEYAFFQADGIAESDEAPIGDLHIEYRNAEGKVLHIYLVEMLPTGSISFHGEVKETLTLDNGKQAYYSESVLNSIRFNYDNDRVIVNIQGDLTKAQLLQMANSIR